MTKGTFKRRAENMVMAGAALLSLYAAYSVYSHQRIFHEAYYSADQDGDALLSDAELFTFARELKVVGFDERLSSRELEDRIRSAPFSAYEHYLAEKRRK